MGASDAGTHAKPLYCCTVLFCEVLFSTEHLLTLVIKNVFNSVIYCGFFFWSGCALPRHLLHDDLPVSYIPASVSLPFLLPGVLYLIGVRSALAFFVRTMDTAAGFSNQKRSSRLLHHRDDGCTDRPMLQRVGHKLEEATGMSVCMEGDLTT